MTTPKQIGLLSLPVFVAALGYFVDVYDLLLFTIVRQPSVLSIGSTMETIIVDSAHIINWQMSIFFTSAKHVRDSILGFFETTIIKNRSITSRPD